MHGNTQLRLTAARPLANDLVHILENCRGTRPEYYLNSDLENTRAVRRAPEPCSGSPLGMHEVRDHAS